MPRVIVGQPLNLPAEFLEGLRSDYSSELATVLESWNRHCRTHWILVPQEPEKGARATVANCGWCWDAMEAYARGVRVHDFVLVRDEERPPPHGGYPTPTYDEAPFRRRAESPELAVEEPA